MNPTPEQEYILSLLTCTTANLQINALAGSGKTTMLEMIQEASPTEPLLYLAFNKRIIQEIQKRLDIKAEERKEAKLKPLPIMEMKTLNSFGHGIWANACAKRLEVDKDKSKNIFRSAVEPLPKSSRQAAWDSYRQVIEGVSMAKAIGYVPERYFPNANHLATKEDLINRLDEEPEELTLALIDLVLVDSIKAAYNGSIDFDDQIYMPALFGGTFPKFPLVLVDEAQDLSPCNHAMLQKLRSSRIIAVGDPWQSIYAFRGADHESMAKLNKTFSMTEADLSVSFRCPSEIVKNVHWRVPHMKWSKEGGKVQAVQRPTLNGIKDHPTAILCRNNAPLFRLALHLLANGRSVSVAGSEIGPKVIGIMQKLGDGTESRTAAARLVEQWREQRLARGSTTAGDIADCMRVFLQFGDNLSGAIFYAKHLFKQEGSLKLSTGHKAKGLEWDTVYHLDPGLIGHSEQELNLKYVISTRSKNELFEIHGEDLSW